VPLGQLEQLMLAQRRDARRERRPRLDDEAPDAPGGEPEQQAEPAREQQRHDAQRQAPAPLQPALDQTRGEEEEPLEHHKEGEGDQQLPEQDDGADEQQQGQRALRSSLAKEVGDAISAHCSWGTRIRT